jgi:predicted nucleic acid-binding protein
MYLVDTNVLSEARKGQRADSGVVEFFAEASRMRTVLFLSVITVGELRRGMELIRYRGDEQQASRLESWLDSILTGFQDWILDVDPDVAQVWARLRVPHAENALDKLIAATALIHDLTVVTRNYRHFEMPGLRVLNPFSTDAAR